jgi:hypothetical protein
VALLVAAVACRREPTPFPLLVGPQALHFTVLAESGGVLPPGSPLGSRLGPGWRWSGAADGGWAAGTGAARFEIVNLGEEVERTLAVSLSATAPGGRVVAHAGPRMLGAFPLSSQVAVRLPADLPIGRVPVDLDVTGGGAWTVRGATVAPVVGAGAVTQPPGEVVQAPNSLAIAAVQLRGFEILVGTFVPPEEPLPGQRWQLAIERPDGSPIRRFEWLTSMWNRWRGARAIELPLRGVQGWVRLRLLALGPAGSAPARWRGLALTGAGGRELPPGQ